MTRQSAGLPLSVGQASLPVRIAIALVLAVTAALCLGGGIVIARTGSAGRVLAAILIEPLGLIGILATAFVLAPHSRFGAWLDHFVPRLAEPRVALGTAAALVAVSLILVI